MTEAVEPNTLTDRIRKAVEADEVELPPLPELVIKLRELLADDRADVRKVTELVRNEPAVVASLLRFANSAVFGGLRPITDLNQAIARLGLKQVSSLVTAMQLKDQFSESDKERAAILKLLWDHSVACAYFSQRLAERNGTVDAEQAFLAGLLHDIGRLIVLRAVDHLEGADGTRITGPVLDDLMTAMNNELGHLTLTRWKLPEILAEVALRHGEESASDDPTLLTIVQAADVMSRKMGFHIDPDPELELLDEAAVDNLDLADIELATLMVDLEDDFSQVREMF